MSGCAGPGMRECWFRCGGCFVPSGGKRCLVWPCCAGRCPLPCSVGNAVPGGFSCVAGWFRSQALRCAQGRFRVPVPNRGLFGRVRGLQMLSGSGGVWQTIPRSPAALRCCAQCSPLYWPLPANTQLPPYGGLRESELKCLRSHPTPLRFYPQALSGAPALS